MINNNWKPEEFNEKELLDFIPEINDLMDVKTIDLLNIDSSNMQPKHWLEITKTIKNSIILLIAGFIKTCCVDRFAGARRNKKLFLSNICGEFSSIKTPKEKRI
ncbi:MAG: hypothetical protein DRP06_04415 [Candidatus Aenigmatarchaeota archaeon]|nr:MAG: hypothetical protein DRP06_04415 [Candidatus Aenigmarchaeota archaeon]